MAKHGVENFQKEILFTFDDAEKAFLKEEEIVQQHGNNPLCYNLRKGGEGGFDWINQNGLNKVKSQETRRRMSVAAAARAKRPECRKILIANGKKTSALYNTGGRPPAAAIETIRQKAVGRRASQMTKWRMSAIHRQRSSEFNSWCVRKRLAAVKGLPFFEVKPTIYLFSPESPELALGKGRFFKTSVSYIRAKVISWRFKWARMEPSGANVGFVVPSVA